MSGQNGQRVEKILDSVPWGPMHCGARSTCEALKGASRMRGRRNARVGGIKVNVGMEVGMFRQTCCRGLVSPSPEHVLGVAVTAGGWWERLPVIPSIVKPNLSAKPRVGTRIKGTKVKVSLVFEHFSYEVIASVVPERVTGVDIVSERGTFPVSGINKTRGCAPARHTVASCIGHAKWAPVRLPEVTQITSFRGARRAAYGRSLRAPPSTPARLWTRKMSIGRPLVACQILRLPF